VRKYLKKNPLFFQFFYDVTTTAEAIWRNEDVEIIYLTVISRRYTKKSRYLDIQKRSCVFGDRMDQRSRRVGAGNGNWWKQSLGK